MACYYIRAPDACFFIYIFYKKGELSRHFLNSLVFENNIRIVVYSKGKRFGIIFPFHQNNICSLGTWRTTYKFIFVSFREFAKTITKQEQHK